MLLKKEKVRSEEFISEFTGIFLLVFFGTGAIVFDELHGGILGAWGIAAFFGGAVFFAITLFGRISGAHINPIVTLALMRTDNDKGRAAAYIAAQLAGAFAASLIIASIFGTGHGFGATRPAAGLLQSLVLEAAMSFALICLVLQLKRNEAGILVSAASIGILIFLEAGIGGPLTGASMNPARSMAPALFSGEWETIWIYTAGPIAGGLLANRYFLYNNNRRNRNERV